MIQWQGNRKIVPGKLPSVWLPTTNSLLENYHPENCSSIYFLPKDCPHADCPKGDFPPENFSLEDWPPEDWPPANSTWKITTWRKTPRKIVPGWLSLKGSLLLSNLSLKPSTVSRNLKYLKKNCSHYFF